MHHIQRKILGLLMHAPSLTYAQMRPKGVESNHFAYHLEQLVKAGIIAKSDRSYTLTTEGLALADRVSHGDMAIRKQPHIVTTIHITNSQGQVLLFRHAFQPYIDMIGFPQGRTHYDERVGQAASRELFEKTGLQDVELSQRGIVYISAARGGQNISKIIAHVFSGAAEDGQETALVNPQQGACAWYDWTSLKAARCMPGFWQLKTLLDTSDGFFFAEIEDELR